MISERLVLSLLAILVPLILQFSKNVDQNINIDFFKIFDHLCMKKFVEIKEKLHFIVSKLINQLVLKLGKSLDEVTEEDTEVFCILRGHKRSHFELVKIFAVVKDAHKVELVSKS